MIVETEYDLDTNTLIVIEQIPSITYKFNGELFPVVLDDGTMRCVIEKDANGYSRISYKDGHFFYENVIWMKEAPWFQAHSDPITESDAIREIVSARLLDHFGNE